MLSEEVGSTRKSVGGGIWWIYAWNRLSHVGQHDMPLIPSSRTAQGSPHPSVPHWSWQILKSPFKALLLLFVSLALESEMHSMSPCPHVVDRLENLLHSPKLCPPEASLQGTWFPFPKG